MLTINNLSVEEVTTEIENIIKIINADDTFSGAEVKTMLEELKGKVERIVQIKFDYNF